MVDDDLERRLGDRLQREPDVLVAYLFGSVARGRAGPLSDMDVAVLLSPEADVSRRHPDLVAAVADVTGLDKADVVVLNEAPPALGFRVLRDGRLLFSATRSPGSATERRRSTATSTWRRCAGCTRRDSATDWPRVALVDDESVERRLRHIAESVAARRAVPAEAGSGSSPIEPPARPRSATFSSPSRPPWISRIT